MRKDAACLAALCAALWFAPPAHAGSYDVVSCLAPGAGAINRSWSVETYDVAGRASPSIAGFGPPATPENCGTTGIGLRSSVSASRTVTSGQGAAFVFHAPDGSLVRTVKIWRFGQARASSSAAATPTWVIATRSGAAAGGPTVLGGTSGADYCPSATHPAPAWPGYCAIGAGTFATGGYGEYDDVLTPTVSWGMECSGATPTTTCVTGDGTGANAGLQFQGADVTVEDDNPPAMDAGSAADGWHRPQDALVAGGADAGGLRQMTASIDGNPVTSATYTCDFHLAAPCPTAQQLAVPLAGLADGPHNVTVTGVDAASNGGRGDRVVDVDGTAPALDLVPTRGGRTIVFAVSDASSGVKSGQIAIRAGKTLPFTPLPTTLRGGRLRATVPKGKRPSDFGIAVSATDSAGNVVSGQATTMTLNTRLGEHLRKVRGGTATVPYRHRVVITGRLATIDGVPLAGLPVTVTTTLHQSHATPQPFRTVVSSRTGRFSFSVPPGPSRRVDVSLAGGAGLLHRTRSVNLRVPAGSTIRASRTTVFGTATVCFSGRLGLLGARLPAGGKIVVLEAEQHGRWSTVASTRARGRHAAWRADAHFRGNPGRFPVRLRIPREAVFPYDAGHSRAIPIRVL